MRTSRDARAAIKARTARMNAAHQRATLERKLKAWAKEKPTGPKYPVRIIHET